MQKYWQWIWSFLGSVPLWLKIMGIAVLPLLLVVSVAALYIHKSIWIPFSAILVGIGLAYGFSLILALPLKQLLDVIQRVKGGDLSARVKAWKFRRPRE